MFLAAFVLLAAAASLDAHTSAICARDEPGGGVTFFAATYHFPGSPVGGIIVDGVTYAFTGIIDPLPAGVTNCSAFCFSLDESGVNWQTVTVLGLTPGSKSLTTTSTSAVESPGGSPCTGINLTVAGGGVGGCPAHRTHGHISTIPPTHSGVSHVHHGQHGHKVAANCPPHAPGHTGAGAAPEREGLLNTNLETAAPAFVAALNEDGTLNGSPSGTNAIRVSATRPGGVLQMFGSAEGLFLGDDDESPVVGARGGFTPPASGSPLYYTTSLPLVRIGGLAAKV
ncbi:MAG: hypothetical protein HY236_03370, partial [Acidobacteria bacterium]|nr:hypothetical protein [Acidobacteriota bacterium]